MDFPYLHMTTGPSVLAEQQADLLLQEGEEIHLQPSTDTCIEMCSSQNESQALKSVRNVIAWLELHCLKGSRCQHFKTGNSSVLCPHGLKEHQGGVV